MNLSGKYDSQVALKLPLGYINFIMTTTQEEIAVKLNTASDRLCYYRTENYPNLPKTNINLNPNRFYTI